MQSCGLTMSLSRYFIDVSHIFGTGASLLLRYTFCLIPSPTQDHSFEFFGGPRFRWLHGTRGLLIPFSTFILVCFWRMVNLHNYFWNLTLRLHKFKGFIDEYYYFFREINFRRYLKWNRTKEKLKSQTYFWGAIVAGDNIVLVFFNMFEFLYPSLCYYIILFETNGHEDFLNFFLQYFIFSLGFSMYLHKTVSIYLHFFHLVSRVQFCSLEISIFHKCFHEIRIFNFIY